MREWNARRGGRAQRRGDAGHDDVRNSVRSECFDLFTAATEDERIAALEARDPKPALRILNEQLVNAGLRGVMIAARFLADKYALRIATSAVEHRIGNQTVVQNHVGLRE